MDRTCGLSEKRRDAGGISGGVPAAVSAGRRYLFGAAGTAEGTERESENAAEEASGRHGPPGF